MEEQELQDEWINDVIPDRPKFDIEFYARKLRDQNLYIQPCPQDWWANIRNDNDRKE
jgi:hypothetical protein